MRSSIALAMFVCAIAMPAFCQKDQPPAPDSAEARELKACGPKDKEVKYAADTDKTSHPLGVQPADKALIYILRQNYKWLRNYPFSLAVDGEWKGVNRHASYFFFTLEPGLHNFCSRGMRDNRGVLTLTVEAGKTYYIEQEDEFSRHALMSELSVLNETEGKNLLAKTYPSTWKVK